MAEWIAFKECVRLHTLACDSNLWWAMGIAAKTAPPLHHITMLVTSVSDPGHSEDSLHYVGRAFDLRFRGTRKGAIDAVVDEQEKLATLWVGRMKRLLGPGWDVIVEVDHIHVEYDPK